MLSVPGLDTRYVFTCAERHGLMRDNPANRAYSRVRRVFWRPVFKLKHQHLSFSRIEEPADLASQLVERLIIGGDLPGVRSLAHRPDCVTRCEDVAHVTELTENLAKLINVVRA